MPPKIKIVCTDKIPLPQGTIRQKPGFCFKQGLRVGFAAGAQKATKIATEQGVKRARIVKAIPPAALRMQAVRGKRKAKETTERRVQERENALMAANDTNIEIPRVKPAGRKQKFRNFYDLDEKKKPSIKEILDRINPRVPGMRNGKPIMKKRLNDGDLLISNGNFNVPELTRDVKKDMGIPAMKAYLIANKGYRA